MPPYPEPYKLKIGFLEHAFGFQVTLELDDPEYEFFPYPEYTGEDKPSPGTVRDIENGSIASYDVIDNKIRFYFKSWRYARTSMEYLAWVINHEFLHYVIIRHVPGLAGCTTDIVKHHIPYYFGLDEMEINGENMSYIHGRVDEMPRNLIEKYDIDMIDPMYSGTKKEFLREYGNESLDDHIIKTANIWYLQEAILRLVWGKFDSIGVRWLTAIRVCPSSAFCR